MTLLVHTARVSSADPDRFDISRRSGGPDGAPFAPSWAILTPAIKARQAAKSIRAVADGSYAPSVLGPAMEAQARVYRVKADDLESRAWAAYVPAYTAEMRASYRVNRAAWDSLLARTRVVLCCYCSAPTPDALRCHRRLLAGLLVKLGATDGGEL